MDYNEISVAEEAPKDYEAIQNLKRSTEHKIFLENLVKLTVKVDREIKDSDRQKLDDIVWIKKNITWILDSWPNCLVDEFNNLLHQYLADGTIDVVKLLFCLQELYDFSKNYRLKSANGARISKIKRKKLGVLKRVFNKLPKKRTHTNTQEKTVFKFYNSLEEEDKKLWKSQKAFYGYFSENKKMVQKQLEEEAVIQSFVTGGKIFQQSDLWS